MVWRSALLNIGEFVRHDIKENANFIQSEIESKKQRFRKLRDIYSSPKLKSSSDDQARKAYFEVRQGNYSSHLTIKPDMLRSWWEDNVEVTCGSKTGDIIEVGEKIHNKVDLIITDPPYGFNVAIGSPDEQIKFYKELIGTFLQAVKNFGQIIFCLPDESINGQSVPFYLRKAWILREFFIQVAEKYPGEGRIIEISSTKPRYGTLLYAPPYYWRSKRALTRTVMHIVVQKSTCRCQNEAGENGVLL